MSRYISQLLILLLLSGLLFTSCLKPCGECFTPPTVYSFSIMDSANGTDLLFDSTFEQKNVKIFDQNNSFIISNFYTLDNLSKIVVNSEAFWRTGYNNFQIRINDSIIIPFSLEQTEMSDRCCTWYEMGIFKVDSFEYMLNNDICEVYLK